MYTDILLSHFKNPHNSGNLSAPSASVEATNPVCGDVLRLEIQIEETQIVAARFKAQGCVAAIAAGSLLTDLLTGKSLADAGRISAEDISEALGTLPPAMFHAAQLCKTAVSEVLRNFRSSPAKK
jgi:NifU-like protein involved in Fe-S cluster formation